MIHIKTAPGQCSAMARRFTMIHDVSRDCRAFAAVVICPTLRELSAR